MSILTLFFLAQSLFANPISCSEIFNSHYPIDGRWVSVPAQNLSVDLAHELNSAYKTRLFNNRSKTFQSITVFFEGPNAMKMMQAFHNVVYPGSETAHQYLATGKLVLADNELILSVFRFWKKPSEFNQNDFGGKKVISLDELTI